MQHVHPRALETKSAVLETKEAPTGDETNVEKALADLTAEFKSRSDALALEVKAAKDRADALEMKINRPGTGTATEDSVAVKAFGTFMRKGVERVSADEVKALVVSNDANGGYLAPEEFGSELIKNLVEFSPIRQYARVVSIGAVEVKYPRRTAGTSATWVSETGDRSASQPTFDQVLLTPHELATFTDVSNALLEDNAYNLESELSMDWAESFGKSEGAAFVSGDGVGKPRGLLAAAGIAEIPTGHASTITADSLIIAFYSLPAAYRNRGAWMMNGSSLAAVRLLKDGQGNYLWRPGLAEGQPETILGRPVVEAVDMPDIEAEATPIIFGDMSGYRIVDRIMLSVLRDPYTLATKGQVRFHARKRVGGDVTNPDRFVKLLVDAGE